MRNPPSLEITEKVTSRVKRTSTITLGRKELLYMLRQCVNGDIPEDVTIAFTTPGGGDWSNTSIDIDAENPVTASWIEEYQE